MRQADSNNFVECIKYTSCDPLILINNVTKAIFNGSQTLLFQRSTGKWSK